jgi:hypothetical protein
MTRKLKRKEVKTSISHQIEAKKQNKRESAPGDGDHCWTNMRTWTKRTQGTENLDAFIRLNMQIAHFLL